MIPLEDRFPPGVADEEREHLNRWASSNRGAGASRSESGWWPDDATDDEWDEHLDWIARNDGRRCDQEARP